MLKKLSMMLYILFICSVANASPDSKSKAKLESPASNYTSVWLSTYTGLIDDSFTSNNKETKVSQEMIGQGVYVNRNYNEDLSFFGEFRHLRNKNSEDQKINLSLTSLGLLFNWKPGLVNFHVGPQASLVYKQTDNSDGYQPGIGFKFGLSLPIWKLRATIENLSDYSFNRNSSTANLSTYSLKLRLPL